MEQIVSTVEHGLHGRLDLTLEGAASYLLIFSAALFFIASVAHLLAVHARHVQRSTSLVVPVPPAGTTALEVDYLERMYDHEPRPERISFRVGDVVAAAAQTGRTLGLNVSVLSRDEVVEGVPGDLATVLDTLVTTISRSGTQREVQLRSERRGTYVEVAVGPAARAEGSGMGLYISRNLLRDQGGDLVVRDTAHGRTFIARIPTQRSPSHV